MGISSSISRLHYFKQTNKDITTIVLPLISSSLTKEDILDGTVIDEDSIYEEPSCKNIHISKLEKILKTSFKPKHNVYHEWINLYLWHKYCDIDKVPNYYNFIPIYSDETINKRNINIELILLNKYNYYFIIKYHIIEWGENFSLKYNAYDKFTYKIQTPQAFDKTIEYFANIGYQTINSLKPLREIFEDEYSDEYL